MISITAVTGAGIPHRPISGIPINTAVNTTLKISFQLNTAVGPGAEWFLCAGTPADFAANNSGLQLASVTGAKIQTLTVIDTDQLAGRLLYILSQGTSFGPSQLQFTIQVE
jgi:hypothetical protein